MAFPRAIANAQRDAMRKELGAVRAVVEHFQSQLRGIDEPGLAGITRANYTVIYGELDAAFLHICRAQDELS